MKEIYNAFAQSTIRISYLGVSDDDITTKLIQLAESYLRNLDGLDKLSKKVPFLIAESFQNVIRHSNQIEKDSDKVLDKDFFQIDFLSDRVIICAANPIRNEFVELLSEKIDSVNILSQDDLKKLWLNTLSNGDISSKGGAGLGVIQMARKSGMPIKKKFVQFDDEMSIFFLGMEIIKNSNIVESDFDISRSEEQYNNFLNDGVILQYNGHFSEETNFPIIEILENNLVDPSKMDSDTAENITMIIEILQNVSKHGMILNALREGVFSIYESNNEQFITCGNYINPEIFEEFKEYLERVKSMNMEELKADRNQKMLDAALSDNGDGGLGLIEIAIFTKNTFEYSFHTLTNNCLFFTLEIKLKSSGKY